MPRLCSSLLLSLLLASSASAVTMAWTPVGNPGNICDPQSQGCFGAVAYSYRIGTYEVTNAQYAEFLNAKASSDPFFLYNQQMGSSNLSCCLGGITKNGSDGNFSYSVIAGRGEMPVNNVTLYDAMRFANWLHNGQGTGDTETGAYTLLGGMPTPSNAATVTRNAAAIFVIPSEDEWYKAAYYDAISTSYFDYPAGSDTTTTCSFPATTGSNVANCFDGGVDNDLAIVGSYSASPSPYGTFDQGGNVFERNETIIGDSHRGLRGGSFRSGANVLAAASRFGTAGASDEAAGFRLAMIPEPGTGLLVIAGLLSFAGWRRARA